MEAGYTKSTGLSLPCYIYLLQAIYSVGVYSRKKSAKNWLLKIDIIIE